jgi:Spirocyclase AveC-like
MPTNVIEAEEQPPRLASRKKPEWGFAQFLALAAIPLLGYQIWTVTAWLLSGPYQVLDHRNVGSASWDAAWAIQIALSVGVAAISVKLWREYRRERRLTFDAMLFIGLVLTVFWDTVVNFIQPLWFYSTDWINLNEWWGHAPLVVSPAAGHGPFPVWALLGLYPCFLAECWMTSSILAKVQRRWPAISPVRLVVIAFVMACAIGACLSMVMILPHLWGGAGMGPSILGGDYRWPFAEFLYIGFWSTTLVSLRFFVDDRGQRLTELGLDHLRPRTRTTVRLLATIAFCNLSVILWSVLVLFTGLYARPYPNYPQHLSNVVCDTPALPAATGYGPCPGTPGFRIPLRQH